MLILLILLLIILQNKDSKYRSIIYLLLATLFLQTLYSFYYLCNVNTLYTEDESNKDTDNIIEVILTVEPNTQIVAWTMKPLLIYKNSICSDTTCSIHKISDENGEVCINIVASSLDYLPDDDKIIYYKYINKEQVTETKHAYFRIDNYHYNKEIHNYAPAPYEYPIKIKSRQSIGNVINNVTHITDYSINDEFNFKKNDLEERFNTNNHIYNEKININIMDLDKIKNSLQKTIKNDSKKVRFST